MTRTTLLWALPALLATACTGTPTTTDDSGTDTGDSGTTALIPAPDLADLVDPGGCSDLAMTLGSTAGDLVLLMVYNGGLSQAAFDAKDGTASASLDLSVEGSLELWQGIDVTNIPCNDALNGTEEVVTLWTAVSGTAQLDVVSDGEHKAWDAWPGTTTLVLSDVVLSADGAADVSIPTLSWTAYTGWLPG